MTKATRSDWTRLVRWNWIQVKGNSCSTFVITACQSVKHRATTGIFFTQRERKFKEKKITECTRKLLIYHLLQFMIELRSEGHKVIIAVYVNENVMSSKLPNTLSQIGLVETFYRKFRIEGPAWHDRDKEPVDGLWSYSGLVPSNVVLFLHSFGSSNYRVTLA